MKLDTLLFAGIILSLFAAGAAWTVGSLDSLILAVFALSSFTLTIWLREALR